MSEPQDTCDRCGESKERIHVGWAEETGFDGLCDECLATAPRIPTNLPRLAQDYTPEQREAVVNYLASLSLEDLRLRQAIKNEEITRAFRKAADEILESVQAQADQIFDALLRKLR